MSSKPKVSLQNVYNIYYIFGSRSLENHLEPMTNIHKQNLKMIKPSRGKKSKKMKMKQKPNKKMFV